MLKMKRVVIFTIIFGGKQLKFFGSFAVIDLTNSEKMLIISKMCRKRPQDYSHIFTCIPRLDNSKITTDFQYSFPITAFLVKFSINLLY